MSNAFNIYFNLAKTIVPDFDISHEIEQSRSLFSLKKSLLTYEGEILPDKSELNSILKNINVFSCYYSQLQEYLMNDNTPLAQTLYTALCEWYQQNAKNQNIGELKAFVNAQIEKHLAVSSWSWSSQPVNLRQGLENIVDEIPATDLYVNEKDKIFSEIRELLEIQSLIDLHWAENIKNILSCFNEQRASDKPWLEIKQALRKACAEQLTPSMFSFYNVPEVKGKLLELIENISSERYCEMFSYDIKQGLGKLLENLPEVSEGAENAKAADQKSKPVLSFTKNKRKYKEKEPLDKPCSSREEPRTQKKSLTFKWG